MRIKKLGTHRQEYLYLAIAALLAVALITYLVFLIRSLSVKATAVFGNDVFNRPDTQTFNFKQYDALMQKLYPGDSTVLSTYQQPVAQPMPTPQPVVPSASSSTP
jgi:hypothetical protein